jgi:hypothetical protein
MQEFPSANTSNMLSAKNSIYINLHICTQHKPTQNDLCKSYLKTIDQTGWVCETIGKFETSAMHNIID